MSSTAISRRLSAPTIRCGTWGVRQAPFYVIMGTTMPAVLAEVNFLSNRTDAGMMDSARFREETARGLYRGIVAYYRTVHPEERALRASAHVAGGGFAP